MKKAAMATSKQTPPSQGLIELVPVLHGDIERVWADVVPVLEPVVARQNRLAMGDVKNFLQMRRLQLWLGVELPNTIRAAAVTEIANYPQTRVCVLLFLAGKGFEDWRHFWGDLESWALQNGCEEIEWIGRPGWAKKMPEADTGERVYKIKIIKDAEDG